MRPRRFPSVSPGFLAIMVAFAAVVLQTLVRITNESARPSYLALFTAYLVFYIGISARSTLRHSTVHVYLAAQSVLILGLLALDPESDVVTGLFALLNYHVAMRLSGKARWAWLVALVVLTGGSLMLFLGALRGIALAMTPTAAGIALALLVVANQDSEIARAESQTLVDDLRQNQRQLREYADQVQELVVLEERNRLARELHDSISQTMFGITLTLRSIQILLDEKPQQARDQLLRLQEMADDALAAMRRLVAKLRPQGSQGPG